MVYHLTTSVQLKPYLYNMLYEGISFLLRKLAMANLIRGNELELALCVGTVLGEAASQATHYILELLARKYMTATAW